jgi:hypothetical protein
VLFALLFAFQSPAWAIDPLLMLLLGIARDRIVAKAVQAATDPQLAARGDVPAVYVGTTVRPDQLQRLIDDSFAYLSESQRAEIFDALNAELVKPKNAAVRGAMIQYFAEKALAVRAAQLQLARLSQPEKERLARQFGQEVAALPEREQRELGEVLRQGLLPVPHDLGQLLLAALER